MLYSRWGIVVHGGIDGFSRLDNQASTVLNLFTNAVNTFGLPSRVRCDKGDENYDVGWYMLNHPQEDQGVVVLLLVIKNKKHAACFSDQYDNMFFLLVVPLFITVRFSIG